MAFLNDRPDLRRELLIGGLCLAVGGLVMPVLIYIAGSLTLGPYGSNAGFGTFLGDFYGGLFGSSAPVWAIVLGPYVLFSLLRATIFMHRRLKA